MEYTDGMWQGIFSGMSGAWPRADKVCFRTVAEGAGECTLLLFAKGEDEPVKRIPMLRIGNSAVFYAEVLRKDLNPFETYMFEREDGCCFTDAYAKSICGKAVFGKIETQVRPKLPQTPEEREAGFVCPAFSSLIFYKLHVRGFTKHVSSGVKKKGTFAGLEEKIPYLSELGINAVLLMPAYEFDECMEVSSGCGSLSAKQLAEYEARYGSEFVKVQQSYEKEGKEVKTVEKVNYWGYTDKNYYFAPKTSYAAEKENAEAELRHLTDALHKAGIAVFFEFFFRDDVKQCMITDCLRYWTYVYGADGFRLVGGDRALPLLLEDPYLSGVKFLVTEYRGNGFSTGNGFEERRVALYNDGFRNVMRRFVKGDENVVGEFVNNLSSDTAEYAQIRYIADQNGFSLYDIYAYDRKHNEENGEENRDGETYNHSWNCGIEGETAKKKIRLLRERLRKNALSTVFLAQSVPLLFAGDELCHTKSGNNNAYCQDNEISWLNWRLNKEKREQLAFVKELIAFRKEHGVLCGGRKLRGSDWKGVGMPDISYHGVTLWQPDFAPYSRTVSVLLSGAYSPTEREDDLYLLFNMHWEELLFALPVEFHAGKVENAWEIALSTSGESEIVNINKGKQVAVTADESLTECYCKVPARSVVVLKRKGTM
ncbi:MAG: alpha-amylase [Lachnospiraceae bacterium]|nr:alpha-amylase [Lachnospiraceae bacterium]